jgi:hypothetical protein
MEWETVASKPNHYLMESGHQRIEDEDVVGAIGDYEIKPD